MPSFDTPEPISVTIELTIGDIHLVASDRRDTVVVVAPTDPSLPDDVEAAEQTEVDHGNGRLRVTGPRTRGLRSHLGLGGPDGSIQVTIELPAGSQVHGKASLANLHTQGRLGDVNFKTSLGDLRIAHTGPLTAESGTGQVTVDRVVGRAEVTGAGDVRVHAVDGDAEIKNLNGDTWIGEVTGGLRVTSANGDITVERAQAEVDAKTANGNIRLGEVVQGSVVLTTAAGRLEVGVAEGSAAWVDVRSRFGRLRNDLEAADGPGPSDHTVEIRGRTSAGDILIHRSPTAPEQP